MELRRYLRIIRRWVLLVIFGFVATVTATLWLVSSQTPMYESSGTLLLGPRLPGVVGDAIDASDLLIRGVKIGTTYATVAQSMLIRDQAEERIHPSIDVSDAEVGAEILTDTNILSISVTAADPAASQALAVAVVDETVEYVEDLDDAYVMVPLDEPRLPKNPIGSSMSLTIAIGVVFGLVLGVGLALFAEYLKGDPERDGSVTDARTRLHNGAYLRQRLREEMSRTDRTGRAFSLAGFRVAMRHDVNGGEPWRAPAPGDLKRIGEFLRLSGRREVVFAYLENGEFGSILPDIDRWEADASLRQWEAGIAAILDGRGRGAGAVPHLATYACEYRDHRFQGDREAILAIERLAGDDAPDGTRMPDPFPEGDGRGDDGSGPVVLALSLDAGAAASDESTVLAPSGQETPQAEFAASSESRSHADYQRPANKRKLRAANRKW